MSSENKSLSLVEILAILIFVVGLVFIFMSQKNTNEQQNEIVNARRFQDVSRIADGVWQLTLRDPAFVEFRESVAESTCSVESLTAESLQQFLVPEFFDQIPQDPEGFSYRIAFHNETQVTVCAPRDGVVSESELLVSVTR